jgi:hypothetical protein
MLHEWALKMIIFYRTTKLRLLYIVSLHVSDSKIELCENFSDMKLI